MSNKLALRLQSIEEIQSNIDKTTLTSIRIREAKQQLIKEAVHDAIDFAKDLEDIKEILHYFNTKD